MSGQSQMLCRHPRNGFTLMEVSIVLVIVGLIIGGVTVGRSLIRQSQMMSVATDEQRYVQAALQFQQKYGALPGDFAQATSYWGAMSTCPPAPGQASQGGTLTCNGDGNGQVFRPSNVYEVFLFWQHLANAQMIQGSYTGIAGSAGPFDGVIGINDPASRIEGAGFGISYNGPYTGNTSWYDGIYKHNIMLGSYQANNIPANPALTALEAQALDSKYDDGNPAYGSIRTLTPAFAPTANCATTNVSATAKYNIGSTGPQCSLIFITGF